MWGGGEGRADPFIGPAAFSGPAGENDCRPGPAGNAVFPTTVSPKYSGESAGKARMQTCLDQYRANKANGGNGGLKWIEKGGGYYSECNKCLKGRLEENEHEDLVTMSDEDSYLATRLREVASTAPIGDRKKLIWSSMRNVSNRPTRVTNA
jgi:hypothetical protein